MGTNDFNLTNAYDIATAFIDRLDVARPGRLVFVSSLAYRRGSFDHVPYSAAKAGVHGFTRSLAAEAAPLGVRVNAVAPGFIETDMTAALEENQVEMMSSRIPLGTLGQAEDVANAVAFLASDKAAYITGETLHVNGGLYMG